MMFSKKYKFNRFKLFVLSQLLLGVATQTTTWPESTSEGTGPTGGYVKSSVDPGDTTAGLPNQTAPPYAQNTDMDHSNTDSTWQESNSDWHDSNYDMHDSDNINSFVQSLASIADTLVHVSKVSPGSLKNFHPDKCENENTNYGEGSGYSRVKRQSSHDARMSVGRIPQTYNHQWEQVGGFQLSGDGYTWFMGGGGLYSGKGKGSVETRSTAPSSAYGYAEFFSYKTFGETGTLETGSGWYGIDSQNGLELNLSGAYNISATYEHVDSLKIQGSFQLNGSVSAYTSVNGTGAYDNSIYWPAEYEHDENDQNDAFFWESGNENAGFYIWGNGKYHTGGEGIYSHTGTGSYNATGIGLYRINGTGLYKFFERNGIKENNMHEPFFFEGYAAEGFMINVTTGRYNVSGVGGIAARGAGLYAISNQGPYLVGGMGHNPNSFRWGDDEVDENEDDEHKDDEVEYYTSVKEVHSNYHLHVEKGGFRIESSYGFHQCKRGQGNFTFSGNTNFFAVSGTGKFILSADTTCNMPGNYSEPKCEVSMHHDFNITLQSTRRYHFNYNFTVIDGEIWSCSANEGVYRVNGSGKFDISGTGANSSISKFWDNETKAIDEELERRNESPVYGEFYLQSVHGGFNFSGNGGSSYVCIPGEGLLNFSGDGSFSVQGNGKYVISVYGEFSMGSEIFESSEKDGFYQFVGDGDFNIDIRTGRYKVSLSGAVVSCRGVSNTSYALYGIGSGGVYGNGANSGSSWEYYDDDNNNDENLFKKETYQVASNYNLTVEKGGYRIVSSNWNSFQCGMGQGNFNFSGSASFFSVSGRGRYFTDSTYPCEVSGTYYQSCQTSGYDDFVITFDSRFLTDVIDYNVQILDARISECTAPSGEYQIAASGQFEVSGTGAESTQSTFWDNQIKIVYDEGREDSKYLSGDFDESSGQGGMIAWGGQNSGYTCESGYGLFRQNGSGTFSHSGDGKYFISGFGSYWIQTHQNGEQSQQSGYGEFQYVGEGYHIFQVSESVYSVTLYGSMHNCEVQSSSGYYRVYANGQFHIHGHGAEHGEFWGTSNQDDGTDTDDENDEGWHAICELSEEEQWAAYEIIANHGQTLESLLKVFGSMVEEPLEEMCKNDVNDENRLACGMLKGRPENVNEEGDVPVKCSIFDILGVITNPTEYLSLLDQSVQACSEPQNEDNEYCKSVTLQEDTARAFGALLKTIDEDGLSKILFDDDLVCPSAENQNYCAYRKYLERFESLETVVTVTDDDVGRFFQFLVDIANGAEACPFYFQEICDSSYFGTLKSVVKLVDRLFSLFEDFKDRDNEDDKRVRRQAPPTDSEPEESAIDKFFNTLENIVILASQGKAIGEVFTSATMMASIGQYENAREYCSKSPDWYKFTMCTMDDTESQDLIFDMFDTVWNLDNGIMLTMIADLMTDYDSMKYIVDHDVSGEDICFMNRADMPETINDMCEDIDQQNSVSRATGLVRTVGKAVTSMGPLFCPALSDLERLEPLIRDAFNKSAMDLVQDMLNDEMSCMQDKYDVTDLFNVDRLLEDHDFRGFVCGSSDSEDNEDDEMFYWISIIAIIVLLVLILCILIIVLVIQCSVIRQLNKKLDRNYLNKENGNSEYYSNSTYLGSHLGVSNIEKTLPVPTSVTPSPASRHLKQPSSLPPAPRNKGAGPNLPFPLPMNIVAPNSGVTENNGNKGLKPSEPPAAWNQNQNFGFCSSDVPRSNQPTSTEGAQFGFYGMIGKDKPENSEESGVSSGSRSESPDIGALPANMLSPPADVFGTPPNSETPEGRKNMGMKHVAPPVDLNQTPNFGFFSSDVPRSKKPVNTDGGQFGFYGNDDKDKVLASDESDVSRTESPASGSLPEVGGSER